MLCTYIKQGSPASINHFHGTSYNCLISQHHIQKVYLHRVFLTMNILIICGLSLLFTFAQSEKVVLCYFSSWATYRRGNGKFDVENIDPQLCTHAAYGFAGIDAGSFKIKVLDPSNDLEDNGGKGSFKRFNALKTQNPNLVTLLSVGGWNEGATKYSQMVSTNQSRSAFITSTIDLLTKHGFDGLDFDWEYPGGRYGSPGSPNDKKNYVIFLKELREALDAAGGLILTAAVSAGKATIDKGYDVQAMGKYMDYINVMTYDYHGWWGGHHFTGHNSPLYALPQERSASHPGHNLNADFSMNYYASKGAPRAKLLLGMGAYGRGYTLKDSSINGFYADAISGIRAGPYTATSGFWGYNEYCEKMKAEESEWITVRDANAVAPYSYKGDQWFSYDDVESIRAKSQYVMDQGFGGGFVWSIDTDDFRGICGEGKFPLVTTMNEVLRGDNSSKPITTQKPGSTESQTMVSHVEMSTAPSKKTTESTTATTSSVSPGASSGICMEQGLIPDMENCDKYFSCVSDGMGGYLKISMSCPPGLLFNPHTLNCDWKANVACP